MIRHFASSAAVLVALAIASPALADHPIAGTWKLDPATAKLPTKPDVMLLKDDTYACSTCTPAVTVPADGKFHKVTGHSYSDEMSVMIVDPTTVSYGYRLKGRDVSSGTDTVSADGNTLTSSFKSTNNANGTPVEQSMTETRVAAAPAGAHAISGSWKPSAVTGVSDAGLMVTYKVDGDSVTMTQPTGEHYTATFGGPFVPLVGDPGNTMIAVKKLGERGIEEINKRGGKVVGVLQVEVAADGKSAVGTYANNQAGTKTSYTAYKQ